MTELKSPRMSTWIKKYGPARYARSRQEALDPRYKDRVMSLVQADTTPLVYGEPGFRLVNAVAYVIFEKPIPQNDRDINYNVLGVYGKNALGPI